MSNKRRTTTKKQSGFGSFFICAVVLVVLGWSTNRVADLCDKSNELSETEYALQAKIEDAYLEKEELVALEEYMHTKQYIEDVAKDKLGLVYPDEIVIKPSE